MIDWNSLVTRYIVCIVVVTVGSAFLALISSFQYNWRYSKKTFWWMFISFAVTFNALMFWVTMLDPVLHYVIPGASLQDAITLMTGK